MNDPDEPGAPGEAASSTPPIRIGNASGFYGDRFSAVHEMLTGGPPFPGGTLLDKVGRHAKEKARPVEQLRPDVPPAVSHLIERLLAKNPKDRFQTPAELVTALEAFAVDGPPPWRTSGQSSGESPAIADFPEGDPAAQPASSESVLTPDREFQLQPPSQRRRMPRLRASFPLLVAGAAVVGGVAAYILILLTR